MDNRICRDSFTTIIAEDLVGVAFASDPKLIRILYDFATDETWPKAGASEHFTSTHHRGERLLKRLKEQTAKTDLELGDARAIQRANTTVVAIGDQLQVEMPFFPTTLYPVVEPRSLQPVRPLLRSPILQAATGLE